MKERSLSIVSQLDIGTQFLVGDPVMRASLHSLIVEVRQIPSSLLQPVKIEQLVRAVVQARMENVPVGEEMRDWEDSHVLVRNVERIWIAESGTLAQIPRTIIFTLADVTCSSQCQREPLSKLTTPIFEYTSTKYQEPRK